MSMRSFYFILLQVVLVAMYGNAQSLKLYVFDENTKLPIAGAKILIYPKGQTMLTDNNGSIVFKLATGNYNLSINSIGRVVVQLKVKLSQDTLVNVALTHQIVMLDSVIVSTGYQTIAKERATGSFTLIDKQRYNEQIGSNALERLRYITNGVAPVTDRITSLGQNAMIIRGMSTLTTAIQRPLVIVDGFEYQGDLDNINPNDIEDVTFLKDAAAGSIWGAKAANGVIVLRTKKGKFKEGIKVGFTANISMASEPNLFYDQQMSARELIGVEQFLFANKYRFTDTARNTRPPFSEAYELMFSHKDGKLTEGQLNAALDQLATRDVRNEFARYFYQNEISQQFAFNLSGGSSSVNWYFSAGRDNNISNLNAKYGRNTLRLSNQFNLSNRLNVSLDLAYTGSDSYSGKPAYGDIRASNSVLPIYATIADASGRAVPFAAYYRQGFIDEIGGGKLLDWNYYPLDDYKYSPTSTKLNDINGTLGFDITLLTWLKLNTKYRVQQQINTIQTLNGVEGYYTRNLVNTFTQIATNGAVTYKVPKGDILDTETVVITSQNIRAQLSIDKDFSFLKLVALFGTEWSEKKTEGLSNRYYGYDEQLLTSVPVDVINMYPTYMTGSAASIPALTNFTGLNNRLASLYGNAALSYKNKYTYSISARRDASNIFGQATNDRWKPLWSMGLAWLMSKENWLNPEKVQYLKLRTSYGKQGNIDPRKVALTTLAYGANNPFTQTPFGSINNYPNPNLRWEEVAMLNMGLDFKLWKGKLSGSIEYYRKKMTDLYANVQIDRTSGIASGTIIRNVGMAKGQGFDVELRTQHNLGAFSLSSDLIFNTYIDKIINLNADAVPANQLMSAGFGIVEGYATFALFAYPWAGLDDTNGDPLGYYKGELSKNYSGIVNETTIAQAKYLGSQLPKYFGSIGMGVNWKNLNLAFRFSYKLGYYFRRNSINYATLTGQLYGHIDYENRWQKPGDGQVTQVPSFIYPSNTYRDNFYSNSEALFVKGDHLRLQYVHLSYQLNKSQHQWLPIKNANFIFAANDIGIVWRKNSFGIDPDASTIPRVAKFSLGLSTNF